MASSSGHGFTILAGSVFSRLCSHIFGKNRKNKTSEKCVWTCKIRYIVGVAKFQKMREGPRKYIVCCFQVSSKNGYKSTQQLRKSAFTLKKSY